MRTLQTITALLLASSALAADASADPLLEVGGGEPMGIQADRLDIEIAAGAAVLTGNVNLSKGDLRVKCPRLELRFDTTPHLNWARGSGGVIADVRGVHAEAPEVELDMPKQSLELRGGVRLTRGGAWLQAERASIDMATAKVTATQVKGSIPVPKQP